MYRAQVSYDPKTFKLTEMELDKRYEIGSQEPYYVSSSDFNVIATQGKGGDVNISGQSIGKDGLEKQNGLGS